MGGLRSSPILEFIIMAAAALPNNIPPVNVIGNWVLRAPYYVDPSDIWRCDSLEGMDTLEDNGVDPYMAFYAPKGVSREQFTRDNIHGMKICTLVNEYGDFYEVPTTYIITYPKDTSVGYDTLVLSVNFGPLPATLNLDYLISQITQQCTKEIGVPVKVNMHKIPNAGLVKLEDAKTMEKDRLETISNTISHYGGKVMGEEKLAGVNNVTDKLGGIITKIS